MPIKNGRKVANSMFGVDQQLALRELDASLVTVVDNQLHRTYHVLTIAFQGKELLRMQFEDHNQALGAQQTMMHLGRKLADTYKERR